MDRMDRDSVFFKQAELLLRTLPLFQEEADFALKGGTAINFFVRNMPRLSVDIDLRFLPITDRAMRFPLYFSPFTLPSPSSHISR